jgi:hypothetical protein
MTGNTVLPISIVRVSNHTNVRYNRRDFRGYGGFALQATLKNVNHIHLCYRIVVAATPAFPKVGYVSKGSNGYSFLTLEHEQIETEWITMSYC